MKPIHINLNNNISIVIDYSGGMAEYRYDVYEDNKIIGAMGMDTVIEDPVILGIAVRKHFSHLEKILE